MHEQTIIVYHEPRFDTDPFKRKESEFWNLNIFKLKIT
jgi:hypothetical protein